MYDQFTYQTDLAAARRKVARLKPVKGDISNEEAFDILYLHFIEEWDLERILKQYGPTKKLKDPTIVAKIISHNNGKEAARRHDVRRIFAEMAKACHLQLVLEEMGVIKGSSIKLPTYQQNPPGLHQRYKVEKLYGEDDPNALYFILRLDSGGDDPEWIKSCRHAMGTLIGELAVRDHLPILTRELASMMTKLHNEDPVDGKSKPKSKKAGGGRKKGKGADGSSGGPAGSHLGGAAGTDPDEIADNYRERDERIRTRKGED